jgi:hypothetical protein
VIYEKLMAYREWIPAETARAWQPPQAFRALLEIDPEAEESSTITVASQCRPDSLP